MKKYNYGQFILFILFMLMGLALIIWPNMSALLVTQIVGITLLIDGLATLFKQRKSEKELFDKINFFIGIVLSGIGLWIIFWSKQLISMIPLIVVVLLVWQIMINLLMIPKLKKKENEKILLIFTGVLIVFVVILLLNPFSSPSGLIRGIGITLIFDSFVEIWKLWCEVE